MPSNCTMLWTYNSDQWHRAFKKHINGFFKPSSWSIVKDFQQLAATVALINGKTPSLNRATMQNLGLSRSMLSHRFANYSNLRGNCTTLMSEFMHDSHPRLSMSFDSVFQDSGAMRNLPNDDNKCHQTHVCLPHAVARSYPDYDADCTFGWKT